MKNLLKFVGIVSLALVIFACSKKDDPADNDVFVGTYKGAISFKHGETNKSEENGSVTVVKAGDNYYFRFSDGIEDLKGVELKKGDNNLINVDLTEDGLEIKIIRITASTLYIKYTKEGKTWNANAKR